ncbi:MAG: hypothetical protein IJO26_05510 [Clostridium sp.]|nr:hypothetical protein [Clostridium sp.]
MNLISIIIIIASAVASFKLAEEKGQNKILWTIFTVYFGPTVLAIQYLATLYIARNSNLR